MNDKLIAMGKCQRPHGIKGGASLYLYNPEGTTLKKSMEVTLRSLEDDSSHSVKNDSFKSNELKHLKISSISYGSKKTIVYFDGINDRNQIEALLPFELLIPRSSLPEVNSETEFYLSDLVGLKVKDIENPDLGIIGEVQSFYDNGASPILQIILENNDLLELPFCDPLIPKIDLKQKVVWVRRPEMI